MSRNSADFNSLPALPLSAQKIVSLNMALDRDQEQLIPAICQCPVTTAKIISVANSAAFASRMEITSVKDAVSRIGFKYAHTIAFSIATYSIKNTRQGSKFNMEALWRHNLSTLSIMKRVSQCVDKKNVHLILILLLRLCCMILDISYSIHYLLL